MSNSPHHPHRQQDDQVHDHDRGLAFDLGTLVSRRRLLTLFAGTGAAALLVACGSDSTSSAGTASDATTGTAAAASTAGTTLATDSATAVTTAASAGAPTEAIPEETAGPYPGDGSNGVNVLSESGIVRSDITSSFGTSTTKAEGTPLAISFQVSQASSGAPLAGAAVYAWHCNIDGEYSMYGQDVKDENYLRGVQETDADGNVTFTSIFPAAYSGRWPHIHFEVYASVDDATSGGTLLATSQIALPEETCNLVYATDGYSQSVQNMKQTSLATDNVFSDGWDAELGIITGDLTSGLTVSLPVPV
ncbi:MAG: Protocatechuate dioxygenase [Ilumatobacteraceae bacterium]|nr:Protocatechuate dioxygenase [Ilumatobacteraceae bacterium]